MDEPDVKQRLAAILAADVAGYSRLMGGDERATITTLNQFRAVFREHIEANQGRVVDMAGDSVLAIFETAAGAVLTAVAVQKALTEKNEELSTDRRMVFRIGVHLGDIHEQDDGTIYGDGVNVAARLESLSEPGGICVSDMARGAVKGQLDFGFADLGEQTVKNIAEPVRAYRVLEVGDKAATPPIRQPRRLGWFAAIGAAIVTLGAVGASWWLTRYTSPQEQIAERDDTGGSGTPVLTFPNKPSIAVLPFTNLSGDSNQDYFSDGVTEDIISALSRFRELFVIARNSSFVYKGRAVDVQQVGRELGVRYVLEGSVRRSGERARFAAQLIDATTGGHLWSETYDRDITDIFDVQAEIAQHIAGALVPRIELDAYERSRRISPKDLTAYEHVLLAQHHFNNPTKTSWRATRDLLEEAVRLDPDYARAHSDLAKLYLEDYRVNSTLRAIKLAGLLAKRAVELDPMDWRGHWTLSAYYFHTHQIDLFSAEAEKALELNPNAAEALALLALRQGLVFGMERIEETEKMIRLAMRLDPNHPEITREALIRAMFYTGRYEEAQAELNKAGLSDEITWKHYWTALIQAQIGNLDAANMAAQNYLELRPGWTMAGLIKASNIHPSYWDILFEVAPKAGIPLGDFDGLTSGTD